MIKIYEGEVFPIDMQSYNRREILQNCWNRSDCERLKFLLYDEDRIIGSASYYNVLYDDIKMGTIQMDKEKVFKEGREFFYSGNPREQDCIPVLDENGNCLFLLVYYANKTFDKTKNGDTLDNYEDLDLRRDTEYLDYSLISECDNILFQELEEYTFEIAGLVKEVFPQKEVAFLDDNAELFFDDITILDTIYDTKMWKGRWLFVSSRRKSRFGLYYDAVTLFYNSLKVINSLLWCKRIDTYGDKNEDKTFYLIDVSGGCGLSDIVQYVLTHILIAKRRGWIPYVLLNKYPNQYLKDENDNMWEYYFENVSDVSLEEIMQSKHVISASHNAVGLAGKFNNPYINELRNWILMSINTNLRARKRSRDKNYFNKIIKLNSQMEEVVKADVPWNVEEKMKILGVIVRGTDYNSGAVKARGRGPEVKLPTLENVIRRINEVMTSWGYDYCFVATEDKNVFRKLKENLGTKMLYIEQERVEYEEGSNLNSLADIYQQKHIDTYELGKKYLSVLYALSICNGLLSNMACGATVVARGWNDGQYELDEII